MRKIIEKISNFNNKYELSINARSLSFYFISSIASITIIIVSTINEIKNISYNSIYINFLEIISNIYSILVSDYIEKIRLNGYSIILFLSVIYCLSKVVYSYKKFCEKIFIKDNIKNLFRDIVGSVIIVIDIILLIISNILIYLYSDKLINVLFYNKFLLNISHFIIDLTLLYILVIFFYKIIIPKIIYFKDIKKESLAVSIIIYLLLNMFVLLFNLLYIKNNIVGITFILSAFSFLIFLLNYVILVGFIVINNKINLINNNTGGIKNET